MERNIRDFPRTIERFRAYFEKGEFNYVSFGVGEGRKDGYVINTFFSGHEEDCTYFPVDMSIEMLILAMLHIQDRYDTKYKNRIEIQRDFEDIQDLQDILRLVRHVGGDKPILYGFLGNTISNIENQDRWWRKFLGS